MNETTGQIADEPRTELIALLNRQQEDLTQLRELAARQRQLIQGDQHDELLSLLDQRQTILERLLTRQEKINALSERVRDEPRGLDEETRRKLGHTIEGLSSCLSDIMQRDEEDQKSMERLRDESRKEINSLGNAKQAQRAYMAKRHAARDPRFSDRKG
ncbi:MAG: hypothetical protein EA377_05260 [Phycisphaerales bacterium]|nr:MAG: hypothetical protein EA377_05260 [Phycisphaerales bacterium]